MISSRFWSFLLLSCLVLAAPMAWAADAKEEALSPALRIVHAQDAKDLLAPVFDSTIAAGIPRRLRDHLIAGDEQAWNRFELEVAAAYEKSFTPEQLVQLADFFETEAGQAWLDISPGLKKTLLSNLMDSDSGMRQLEMHGCAVAMVGEELQGFADHVRQGTGPLRADFLAAIEPTLDAARESCDCVFDKAFEEWGAQALDRFPDQEIAMPFIRRLFVERICPMPVLGDVARDPQGESAAGSEASDG